MRRRGLSYRRDVVLLGLDRQERRAADRLGPDALLAPPGHLAPGQIMPLEHGGDRLQVILGGNVHHGEVVVVEPAVRLRALLISSQQIAVELAVRVRMAGRIQRDERGELQKTGVDAAQAARLALRDLVDRRQLEPSQGSAGGDAIDRGRVDAGVDRAGHQRHGQRSG